MTYWLTVSVLLCLIACVAIPDKPVPKYQFDVLRHGMWVPCQYEGLHEGDIGRFHVNPKAIWRVEFAPPNDPASLVNDPLIDEGPSLTT